MVRQTEQRIEETRRVFASTIKRKVGDDRRAWFVRVFELLRAPLDPSCDKIDSNIAGYAAA